MTIFEFEVPAQKDEALKYIADTDTPGRVYFETGKESRRDIQNKLYWHWVREVSEQKHHSAKWIDGESKMLVLLPLMKVPDPDSSERANQKRMQSAEYVEQILECLPLYEHKVATCYRMVRTSEGHMSVQQYAKWLTEFERHWCADGVILTTSEDRRAEALGYFKTKEAAAVSKGGIGECAKM